MYLGNEFTLMDVQVSATNTTGLDLDLVIEGLVSRISCKLMDSFVPGHHSHGAQEQGPQQSCVSWALSIAEHAWSWGWGPP
jgi:hypothetical protein